MTGLRIAFYLFAYRPYGGLQWCFYRIVQLCAQRGHRVDVFTMEWQGPVPNGFYVHPLPVRQLRNHVRNKQFSTLHKHSTHDLRTHT
jgi:UDP-glucose:(heptosyl)LPS alpha-1,3-glucosyltransferase